MMAFEETAGTREIKVLVVEDERVLAWEISSRLGRMGCAVETATSGEEALDMVRRMHPDLVLMDIMLEGEMDGIEAARAMRREQDVDVVFCSAYGGDVRARAESTGPLAYLEKPVNYDTLSSVLRGKTGRGG